MDTGTGLFIPAGRESVKSAEPVSRAGRIEAVLDSVTTQIAAGDPVDWPELERAHADLLPELHEQWLTLQAILEAEVAALEEGATADRDTSVDSGELIEVLNQALPAYHFLEIIHSGGQGTVFKALQHSTRRLVAIKVMQDGPIASERRRQRFEREVKLTCRLQLPNIVQVYDSGVVQGQYYFVMRHVDGLRIDDHALLNCLSGRDRVGLFAETVRAVSRAHQRGVIHRDLKPSNILIDNEGAPQILDFGLAKALADMDDDGAAMSMVGHVIGTLPYLSPEQATGFDEVDVRGDIYALGVVLFELLTGEYPYDLGTTREEARRQILHQPARRMRAVAQEDGWTGLPGRAEIDDDLEAIVAKALAKDKAERYQSAEALLADLEAFLRGDAVSARANQRAYLFRKALRRYRRHLTAAAIVAFALVVAAATSTKYWLQARAERDNARQVATLAHATLDDVVTEIDDNIAPLAGGIEARERLLERVSENLQALEPLVAADFAMAGVLDSLHEKQADIAAVTGRSAEARSRYESLIAAIEPAAPEVPSTDAALYSRSRLHRKLARVSDTPEMHMEQAIAAAEMLVTISPSDDASRELCTNLVALGIHYRDAGRYAEAAELISDARAILDARAVVSANPETEQSWRELAAQALQNEGRIQMQLGNGVLARQSLEECLTIGTVMIAERPYDIQARHQVMTTLAKLSSLLHEQGTDNEATERAQQAIAHGEYLTRVDPRNLRWKRELIVPHITLAILLRKEKDYAAAIRAAAVAVELAEELIAIEPENREWKELSTYALEQRGFSLQNNGAAEAALFDLEQAAELRKSLCASDPENIAYQALFAESHNRLASCLASLSRFEESWCEWQAALTIHTELRERQPEVGARHLEVIHCLVNMAAWHLRQKTPEDDASANDLLDSAEFDLTKLCGSPLYQGLDGRCAEARNAIRFNRRLIAARDDAFYESRRRSAPAGPAK